MMPSLTNTFHEQDPVQFTPCGPDLLVVAPSLPVEPLLPKGEPVEALLRRAQYFVPGTPSGDYREVHREGGRGAEEFPDGTQRAVVGQVAEQQGDQPGGHGAAAGGDGAGRPAPRGPHRVRRRLPAGEFLAEPGRQQQRVVGAGAGDQDRQDALHLAVHPHRAALRQVVDDPAGQAEGEHRTEDDQERQQDAPVHQQQDQQDDADGHPDEEGVDAGEDVREVGLGGGGAGHIGADAVHRADGVLADIGPDLDDARRPPRPVLRARARASPRPP
jgi:hypothetical protein